MRITVEFTEGELLVLDLLERVKSLTGNNEALAPHRPHQLSLSQATAVGLPLRRLPETGTELPIAIDPLGCGCTECLIRTYLPLEQATGPMLALMFIGCIADHTNAEFTITGSLIKTQTWDQHQQSMLELTWDLTSPNGPRYQSYP